MRVTYRDKQPLTNVTGLTCGYFKVESVCQPIYLTFKRNKFVVVFACRQPREKSLRAGKIGHVVRDHSVTVETATFSHFRLDVFRRMYLLSSADVSAAFLAICDGHRGGLNASIRQ